MHALARWREDLADRMIRIFTRDADGPAAGATASARKFQDDPHWRDLILFYEYFHGDTGAGLGASHQTGWTGLVASLIDEWRRPPQPSSRRDVGQLHRPAGGELHDRGRPGGLWDRCRRRRGLVHDRLLRRGRVVRRTPARRPTGTRCWWRTSVRFPSAGAGRCTWARASRTCRGRVPYYRFVETLFHQEITVGCGPALYCPTSAVSREQMAVFVLLAKEEPDFVPPECFTSSFSDVETGRPTCPFIHALARREWCRAEPYFTQ